MLFILLLAIIAVLVLWMVASYNGLVRMRNQVQNGWRQIDVQLKRRHDLIPNLVNTVRGAMDFERDTLTAVMDARARALTASGPVDVAQKEQALSGALGRLLAVAENYPTLKANDNVKMLQEELSTTENQVGFPASSTTISSRATTRRSRCSRPTCSRPASDSCRPNCSRSRAPVNARCRSWTFRVRRSHHRMNRARDGGRADDTE